MRPFEPLNYEELSSRARAALPEDAAPGLKMAAAGANIPLMTEDLVSCLFYLANDPDRAIRSTARRSLTSLPVNLLAPALSANISPKILHWYAGRKLDTQELYERILLNRVTADETFVLLSETLEYPAALDLITQNQARFIRYPEILEALQKNRNATVSSIQRALEFFRRETGRDYRDILAEKRRAAAAEEAAQKPAAEPAVSTPPEGQAAPETQAGETAEAAAAFDGAVLEEVISDDLSIEDLEKEVFETDQLFTEDLLVDPQSELESDVRESLGMRINRMSVLNKMRLALKGNIEARGILIKSSNKLIQECVLRNPRITIEEVIKLSKDKTQREDLIRLIALNRDWVKNYTVALSLCWNPKTPMNLTSKYLNRLNPKDLLSISRSKQVPGLVALQARKLAAEKLRT